jgi:hypothetical protein
MHCKLASSLNGPPPFVSNKTFFTFFILGPIIILYSREKRQVIAMPSSVGSSWSRHSSPERIIKFDPFLILDEHKEHPATSIIELPCNRESEEKKLFCPLCLELSASNDVDAMEASDYSKLICDLFEILDRYCETTSLRKIVLTILEIFLPRRPLILHGDDAFHKILRTLYKLMKSDLYEQIEFVSLAKIMSGLSIRSIQPIPLRSAWQAWTCMLDYGGRVSFGNLIDQTIQNVPENLTKFHIGQAIIVRSYLALINQIAIDWISELVFLPHRKESIYSKYYEVSQTRCLKFTQEVLVPNCDCYLQKESPPSMLELQVFAELFGALRECFINATRRKEENFLEWIHQRDMIATVHRILSRNQSTCYRLELYDFLKTFIQYHIEKDYGELNELRSFMNTVNEIETAANKLEGLDGKEHHCDTFTFYLLLNWVAIRLKSRYFVASRVRRVLNRRSTYLNDIRHRIKQSRLFMRIFAYVAASSLVNSTERNEVIDFFEHDWQEIYHDRTLSVFRYIYCHEPVVFEWAYKNKHFLDLINCDSINYLIERGVKRNHLASTLKILMNCSALRSVLCRYIKRDAKGFFEKLILMGSNGFDRSIMNDFSNWLPALLHETVLRYMNDRLRREAFRLRLINLLISINSLISDSQRLKFNPHFDEQFVIDFTKLVELTYSPCERVDSENQLLLVANDFMALLIQNNNPCVPKLIQYIDFTLIGYMYYILENYRIGDQLGESIARVLIAYDNLDYPFEHHIQRSLYPMPSGAFEWMMSRNTDLHALSVILVEKLYTEFESSYCNHRNLSCNARACIVTGFLHMLCTNLEMIDNRWMKPKLLRIMKFEDFLYHPLYEHLIDIAPNLRVDDDHRDEFESPPSSPDLSFASADNDQFQEEHSFVTKILEQLYEDEGYRSASVPHIPKNIYLNRAIETQTSAEFLGTQEWERRAYEATQTSDGNTQNAQP